MKTCPTCGHAIPDSSVRKRICAICHRAIGRSHKWHFGISGPEHNNCAAPDGQDPDTKPQQMISGLYEK